MTAVSARPAKPLLYLKGRPKGLPLDISVVMA
jgi:hypothetical protein